MLRSKTARLRLLVGALLVALLAAGGVATALPNVPAVVVPNTTIKADPAGILGGKQIRGMVMVDRTEPPEGVLADLPRYKAIGVNTVGIYIYIDADSMTANEVHRGLDTYSDAKLAALTNAIHRAGLAVMWVPYIVMRGLPGAWHGNLKPSNPDRFFADYGAEMSRYAKLAQKYKVEIFSVGTELSALQQSTHHNRWKGLLAGVDRHFRGITTYIATSFDYSTVSWWWFVDVIGISAYFSLSALPGQPGATPVPSVSSLVQVWRNSIFPGIATVASKYGKKVFFGEVGYASVEYATAKPATVWDFGDFKPSQQAQANAYEALLVATKGQWWFRGVAWWRWGSKETKTNNGSMNPRGKRAECVLVNHWGPDGRLAKVNTPRQCKAGRR